MKTNILARAPEAQVGIVPIRTVPNSEEDCLVLARLGRVRPRPRGAKKQNHYRQKSKYHFANSTEKNQKFDDSHLGQLGQGAINLR